MCDMCDDVCDDICDDRCVVCDICDDVCDTCDDVCDILQRTSKLHCAAMHTAVMHTNTLQTPMFVCNALPRSQARAQGLAAKLSAKQKPSQQFIDNAVEVVAV